MDRQRFAASPIGHLVSIADIDGRTGRRYEHVAYVAEPLGAEPELKPSTWRAVARAGRALARLDQAGRQVPNPDLLGRPTLRREAQSTSALEGTFAPLEQVLAVDADSEQTLSKELVEIINYVQAADSAFDWVRDRRSLSVSLLERVHGMLVAGTSAETSDAGRVRGCQVAIGGADGSIEDARFVPMPPGTALTAALRDLTDWIGGPADRDPIVAAAMTHYQFETLHPFNDGNGRIGRLLIVLQLMQDEIIAQPLLSVSPWFEARRTEYQDQLAKVSETGEWDPWIRYFSAGLEASSIDTIERVRKLLDIQQRYVQTLQRKGARGLIRDIVDRLIGQPIVTVPMLAKRFGKSQQGVASAVRRLVSLGILSGPHGSYGKRYIASDIVHVLSAPMSQVATASTADQATQTQRNLDSGDENQVTGR